jgi:hypothetical protein
MSDRHVRILAMIAQRSQRELDAHAVPGDPDTGANDRQSDLRAHAARTRARLAAARPRRRYPPSGGA